MKTIHIFWLTCLLTLSVLGSACVGPLDKVQNVRGAMKSYQAAKTVASMDLPKPIFQNTDVINVAVRVMPREGQDAEAISRAMHASLRENMQWMADRAELDIRVCGGTVECPDQGRVMTVQFTEKGYHDDFVTRMSVGDTLTGEVQYIDGRTGEIVADRESNINKDYAEVVDRISTFSQTFFVASARAEGMPKSGTDALLDAYGEHEMVVPPYRETLEQAT